MTYKFIVTLWRWWSSRSGILSPLRSQDSLLNPGNEADFEVALGRAGSVSCWIALWDCLGNEFRPCFLCNLEIANKRSDSVPKHSHGAIRQNTPPQTGQVATLETRRKLGWVKFRKDFWDCYGEQGKKFGTSKVTIPEVFPRANSAQGPVSLMSR